MNNNIRSINLSGGNHCFVRCPGCYNYFSNKDYETEDLLNFLSTLRRSTQINKVTMAGGEPLAREDMPYILSEIKKMGYQVNLDTVGLSLIRDVSLPVRKVSQISPSEIVPFVDVIGIPLDGSSDHIIDIFRRGLKLDEIMGILKVLSKEVNANVCINTVVHNENKDDLINIYNKIKKFPKIFKWQLFQYMPIGPGGFKNRYKYEITDEQYENAKLSLLEARNNDNVEIEFKSRLQRKNRYLLVDGEGVIWMPKQNEEDLWLNEDSNNQRVIIGKISDHGIADKVIEQIFQLSNVN